MEMIRDISLENTFKISDRISLAEVEAHFQGAMIQSKCFSTIFAIMCKASDMQGLQIVVDSHSSFRCMQGHIEWLAWQHHSVASILLFYALLLHRASYKESPAIYISEGACSPAKSALFGLLRAFHHYGRYISIQCILFLGCGTLITHLLLKRRTFCSSTEMYIWRQSQLWCEQNLRCNQHVMHNLRYIIQSIWTRWSYEIHFYIDLDAEHTYLYTTRRYRSWRPIAGRTKDLAAASNSWRGQRRRAWPPRRAKPRLVLPGWKK